VHTDPGDSAMIGGQDRNVMSAQDERTWSILAHLSMFLNLVTGFLGPVAALVIWLVYRDRSARIAFHALESMWYQIGWLLTLVLIGFVLIPVMALVSVVPFVHAGYAAYRVNQGEAYRYLFAADLVDKR
jgi:uncharacterized protein